MKVGTEQTPYNAGAKKGPFPVAVPHRRRRTRERKARAPSVARTAARPMSGGKRDTLAERVRVRRRVPKMMG